MSRDQKEICLYCMWWKLTGVPFESADKLLLQPGECRFKAPPWEPTKGQDWCGDFTDRPDDHWQPIGEAANRVIAKIGGGDAA